MPPTIHLRPSLDLLCEEYVLVQAWKKTVAYIRSHNWYADTLALDLAAIHLPEFIEKLQKRLRSPKKWEPKPLRMVPAPKSQAWETRDGTWQPKEGAGDTDKDIRPLAHAALEDQVIATAIMLCLADRIESHQGDPRLNTDDAANRAIVISYGNRLFCDATDEKLHHRWGSAKLYRGYYQDYRVFLARPELVKDALARKWPTRKTAIVHIDLSKFYDRVRPQALHEKLLRFKKESDDPKFFELAAAVLNWTWDAKDTLLVNRYASAAELPSFSAVALPQGLVAAGFFANLYLADCDNSLKSSIGSEISEGIVLRDVCRYVDDLRIVVEITPSKEREALQTQVQTWLEELMARTAPGLVINKGKTKAVLSDDKERLWLRQSQTVARIEHGISGGFDAQGGAEVIQMLDALFRSRSAEAETPVGEQNESFFTLVPDMRDETVARLTANRFRRTFRSLRPLLEDKILKESSDDSDDEPEELTTNPILSRKDLDEKASAFAAALVDSWLRNPANVRLLRVAMDLFPDPKRLAKVLDYLRPYVTTGGPRKAARLIGCYCLAEIFRAGATETGIVPSEEMLPKGSDVAGYHEGLFKEAQDLAARFKTGGQRFPWYLKQQVYLYLAVSARRGRVFKSNAGGSELQHYSSLLQFLGGTRLRDDGLWVQMAILTRRAYSDDRGALPLVTKHLNEQRLQLLGERDPAFAEEILRKVPEAISQNGIEVLAKLGIASPSLLRAAHVEELPLSVLAKQPDNPFLDESNLIELALGILPLVETAVVLPDQVMVSTRKGSRRPKERGPGRWIVKEVRLVSKSVRHPLFSLPDWCGKDERWRLILGQLLRFALTGWADYTRPVRRAQWKEGCPCYRVPEHHWLQRRYGYFQGRSAFGPDWLPISTWVGHLLMELLAWPGSFIHGQAPLSRESVAKRLEERKKELSELRGRESRLLFLPQVAGIPEKPRTKDWKRPLRICVAQSVIPSIQDFNTAAAANDVGFNDPVRRARHRAHLAAMLQGIKKLLVVRETHRDRQKRLDWLILPELAVHIDDVNTHLVPFVRQKKCIILAGLVYHPIRPDSATMVNGALWLIPVWSPTNGLSVERFIQGKEFLASDETALLAPHGLVGFRPEQWLIGYRWTSDQTKRPLILSASVCYDATDLTLAADLRDRSDFYAICALNRDVSTFDSMAQALHYHMYQIVLLANNGTYGGSNAYAPVEGAFNRQVFHVHGQPQASVAFMEIDHPEWIVDRLAGTDAFPPSEPGRPGTANIKWKQHPANWKRPDWPSTAQ